ncbi:hypothetical protein PENTCL1PPCAC_14264, partial [Pristionchus entomophagus]
RSSGAAVYYYLCFVFKFLINSFSNHNLQTPQIPLVTQTRALSLLHTPTLLFIFYFDLLAGVPVFLSVDITWRNVLVVCDNEESTRPVPFLEESDRIYALRIMYLSSGF